MKKTHSNPAIGTVSPVNRGRGEGFETSTFVSYEKEQPDEFQDILSWFEGDLSDSELEARILNPLGGQS